MSNASPRARKSCAWHRQAQNQFYSSYLTRTALGSFLQTARNAAQRCPVGRIVMIAAGGVCGGEPFCTSSAPPSSCMMRFQMRLSHIAALAAASWYLLVPMFDPRSGKVVPLAMSEWNEEGIFDSEKDCLNAKRNLVEEYRRTGGAPRIQNIVSAQAGCVASDDPRLQGKVPFSLGPPPPPPK
jgi:hypothetical protein